MSTVFAVFAGGRPGERREPPLPRPLAGVGRVLLPHRVGRGVRVLHRRLGLHAEVAQRDEHVEGGREEGPGGGGEGGAWARDLLQRNRATQDRIEALLREEDEILHRLRVAEGLRHVPQVDHDDDGMDDAYEATEDIIEALLLDDYDGVEELFAAEEAVAVAMLRPRGRRTGCA